MPACLRHCLLCLLFQPCLHARGAAGEPACLQGEVVVPAEVAMEAVIQCPAGSPLQINVSELLRALTAWQVPSSTHARCA
jgi:hypothetical protein